MLHVSYGIPDVRKALKDYFLILESNVSRSFALSSPNTEQDMFSFFSRTIFAPYSGELCKQLCRWAINKALAENFIYESSTDPNIYFLNGDLGKRVGRPKKDE